MRSSKSAKYLAPAIGARVVQFANGLDSPPVATVENLDAAASVAIRYQESDDGNTWTDIANTTATVDPGKNDVQEVASARAQIALFASGNVLINFSVDRVVNGSPTNLGTA